jgi:hypothetical protein
MLHVANEELYGVSISTVHLVVVVTKKVWEIVVGNELHPN